MGSAKHSLNYESVTLSADEIEPILGDWILERHDIDSPGYQRVVAGDRRKMLGKLAKFKVRSMLPSLPRFSAYRDQSFIEGQYAKTWSQQPWHTLNQEVTPKHRIAADWNKIGYVTMRGGLTRLYFETLARAIELLRPKTVLEIGSGMGVNLFVLSTRFPDVRFTGIELTEAGVERAKATQKEAELPKELQDFAPWPMGDTTAFKVIEFQQGSATELPFEDASFDLVFSKTALEQMENVRHLALPEYHRVARDHVVMIEPFSDFNKDSIRPLAIKAKNYLTLEAAELREFGLDPQLVWADWPRKLVAGYGLVIARKI